MKTLSIIIILALLGPVAMAQKTKTLQADNTKPFVLGVIDEIQSAQLGEKRILNIYLPDGYKDDTARYSVIYLLDGSADEDFIHVAGLVQFNSFPWINRIQKTILVGIANVDRKRDFTYETTLKEDKKSYPTTGHSDKFVSFIEKELQPYIEKKYHANKSRTIIGESLGGLLATEILLKKPALFDKYIIISPSLWWDNGSLLRLPSPIYGDGITQKISVYIGVGKEGVWPAVTPHVMEVDANLLADKLKNTKSKSVTVYFDYLPQEDHATIGHQAIFNAIRILFPAPAENK